MVEFRLPLLTLLQLQSYLVPCISVRMFIMPKLQNTYCELFSSAIERLPHCYSARHSIEHLPQRYYTLPRPSLFIPDQSFWEHLSHALPTEMIFDLLRTIPSDRHFRHYSTKLKLNTLEFIVKWLQVSVSECYRQTPQTKNPICV